MQARTRVVDHARGQSQSVVWAVTAPAAAQEIRLGFTPPLTGASAAQGSYQSKAIKLALKQINEAGGINGKKVDSARSSTTNPPIRVRSPRCKKPSSRKRSSHLSARSRARRSWRRPTRSRTTAFPPSSAARM